MPLEHQGRRFRSGEEAARTLSKELGVPEHVALRYLKLGRPIPVRPRRVIDHPDAAGDSPLNRLWRIHKSLLNRIERAKVGYEVDPIWLDYDAFKRDVLPSRADGLQLAQRHSHLPLGPDNFIWMPRQQIVERAHGKPVTIEGVVYGNLSAAAAAYGISTSTLKFRLNAGMTPDNAAAMGPGGKTSGKSVVLDGSTFRSMNAAARYAADRYRVTFEVARDRLRRGRGFDDLSDELPDRQLALDTSPVADGRA